MRSHIPILLLAVALVVGACGDDAADSTTAPSTTSAATTTAPATTTSTATTTTTTTTLATTTTAVATTTEPAYPGFGVQSEVVDPGVYQPLQSTAPVFTVALDTPTRVVRLSDNAGFWIEPDPGWQNGNIPTVQFGRLIRLMVHDASGNVSLVDTPLADPVAALSESAYLVVGETSTLEVDGHPAVQAVVSLAEGAAGFNLLQAPGYTARAFTDGFVITIIDVGDDQMYFCVFAPSEALDEAVAFGEAILGTIDFIG